MSTTEVALVAAAACCVLLGLALVLGRRSAARTNDELAAVRAEAAHDRVELAAVSARLEAAETEAARLRQAAEPVESGNGVLIASVGTHSRVDPDVPLVIERPQVQGTVVDREVVERLVRVAGFTHGVRRALGPAARNRIRFEYRQAVKRARKHRRAETKVAVREYRAKVRAARREQAA